jgi:hypothetical protein
VSLGSAAGSLGGMFIAQYAGCLIARERSFAGSKIFAAKCVEARKLNPNLSKAMSTKDFNDFSTTVG